MTFDDVLIKASDYIGGIIEAHEAEGVFNSRIKGMSIQENTFNVWTSNNKEISVNIKYSEPQELKLGVITYMIPYIGRVYLYKPAKKEQERCI